MLLFNEIDEHKKSVFKVVLWFTFVAGFIFAFLNYSRDLVLLPLIEFITALIAVFLLFRLEKSQNRKQFQKLASVFITYFLIVMMYAFTLENTSISVYTFALIVPLVCYLLLGYRMGFFMTLITYAVTMYLFFIFHRGHEVFMESVAYANVIVCALLIWGVTHFYEYASGQAKQQLKIMAIKDHLTGLYNRTVIDELFAQQVVAAKSNHADVAVLLMDLDRFKSINDEFGHSAGDEVLRQFAAILKTSCPENGASFRLGGEEFAMIFVAPSVEMLNALVESVQAATKEIAIPDVFEVGQVGVSVGVDKKNCQDADLAEMLKQADLDLYQAKDAGRSCCAQSMNSLV